MRKVLSGKHFPEREKKLGLVTPGLLCAVFLTVLTSVSWAQLGPTLEWTQLYAGSQGNEEVSKISSWVETPDGYLIGGSSNAGIGNQKSEASRGDYDFWIVKTDKDGNKIWDKTFGGSSAESLEKIIITPDGGFLLAGTSNSSVSGDKTEASRGFEDFWIVKISALGTKQWDKTYGGASYDGLVQVVNACDGGFLLGGISYSDIGGEKSENTRTVFDEMFGQIPKVDYWLVKVSSNGIKQWDKTYGGGGVDWRGNGEDELTDLVATSDGGYLLGGHSSSVNGFEMTSYNTLGFEYSDFEHEDINYWVIKVNATGAVIWDKVYGGEWADYLKVMIPTPDGGFLLGGNSRSPISGNKTVAPQPGPMPFPRIQHVFLIKISDQGTIQWEKAIQPARDPNTNDNYSIDHISLSENSTGFYLFTESNYQLNSPKHLYKLNWEGVTQSSYLINNDHSLNTEFFKVAGSGDLLFGYSGQSGTNQQETSGYLVSKYTPSTALPSPKVELSVPSFFNFGEPVIMVAYLYNFSTSSNVEFYSDGQKLGDGTGDPQGFIWENPSPGVHHIYAKAIDDAGNIILSPTLPLTVFGNSVTLQRAINLNGAATTVDKIPYESSANAPDFTYNAKSFANQNIALSPSTDAVHSTLIRSCLYGTSAAPATFTISSIEDGSYEVYLYAWEDNFASSYSITIEGTTVLSDYSSGPKGTWRKLGPFVANVTDGDIQIKTSGGDANISSIEIWKPYRTFVQAINVGGNESSLIIDGHNFQGGSEAGYALSGNRYENQSIALIPSTDVNRAKMLRSCAYPIKGNTLGLRVHSLPETPHLYEIYVYVWEDNNPTTYSLEINSKLVLENHNSGAKGTWEKLGPYRVKSAYNIRFSAYGGDANISGIEIWRVDPISFPSNSSARLALGEVSEETATSMNVYPNSFQAEINITFPSSIKGKIETALFDQYGKVQMKANRNFDSERKLQLSVPPDLTSGIYFLKLKTNEGERVIRLIKK